VGDMTKELRIKKVNQPAGRDESNGVIKQANGIAELCLENRYPTFQESFGYDFGFPIGKRLAD
jgi:hypothetical protein